MQLTNKSNYIILAYEYNIYERTSEFLNNYNIQLLSYNTTITYNKKLI